MKQILVFHWKKFFNRSAFRFSTEVLLDFQQERSRISTGALPDFQQECSQIFNSGAPRFSTGALSDFQQERPDFQQERSQIFNRSVIRFSTGALPDFQQECFQIFNRSATRLSTGALPDFQKERSQISTGGGWVLIMLSLHVFGCFYRLCFVATWCKMMSHEEKKKENKKFMTNYLLYTKKQLHCKFKKKRIQSKVKIVWSSNWKLRLCETALIF